MTETNEPAPVTTASDVGVVVTLYAPMLAPTFTFSSRTGDA